jgi:AraC-like DNA-binding protein
MMSTGVSNFESRRFSSEELEPADRIPFYREVLGRVLMRVEVEPLSEEFSRNASFYRLPDLGIFCADGSPVRFERTREMAEGGHEFFLTIGIEGTCEVSQLGRKVVVSAGGATLISAADPMRSERTRSRAFTVAMPRALLAPMVSNMDAALISAIPSRIEPLRLLAGYIDLLMTNPTLMETAELRRLAVHHVHDLVALTLGATRDIAEIAAGRGLRAARMRAIKGDVAQNLAGVTIAALSARHHLSPRYIRKLFEGENTSLSQFVLGQRLTRVHRMLVDPRYADRTITDIVLAVGFGDISTFNREFRRRFGMTPSDVRWRMK